MDQTQNSHDDDIAAAILQIKQWETEGKTEDAVDGCQEILDIDPTNVEAKNILIRLNQAGATMPAEMPSAEPTAPAAPAVTQEPEIPEANTFNLAETPTSESPEPSSEPLYKISTDTPETKETTLSTPTQPEKKKSHGIVLNIVLFIALAAIIGGAIYGYLYFFKSSAPKEVEAPSEVEREEVNMEEEILSTEGSQEADETTEDTEASRNDQRFTDLTLIETKLEEYYAKNRVYPPANELETEIGKLPTDPLDTGEFVYSYAVYGNYLGENQEYILSGVFEDSEMGNTTWTTGASPSDHPDYRDPEAENVIFITTQSAETNNAQTEEEPAAETETPKVKVKR